MAKKILVGMVGGGNDSFMGSIHRAAIEKSGCVELVCGAFGSTRQSSFETGKALGLPSRRVYGTYRDMFRREATLPVGERMDFVSILAPNTMHYPVAMSAIDAQFPVFCEKPFTCNMDEALNLTRKQQNNDVPYGIALHYAGYPALRKAKALIHDEKAIGAIRKVVATYTLGWLTQRLETAGNRQASWRADPRRCGPAGCLIDLGTHCFYAAEWLTGLTVSDVCADLRPTVAGRILDDDCSVFVRFEGGARGVFLSSQIAAGHNDGLSIEVFGDRGSLAWSQSAPDRLTLRGLDCSEQLMAGSDEPATKRLLLVPEPFGREDTFVDALAESYRSFASHLSPGSKARSEEPRCFACVEEGVRSVAFVDAVLKNTAAPEEGATSAAKWTPLVVPPVPEL